MPYKYKEKRREHYKRYNQTPKRKKYNGKNKTKE